MNNFMYYIMATVIPRKTQTKELIAYVIVNENHQNFGS